MAEAKKKTSRKSAGSAPKAPAKSVGQKPEAQDEPKPEQKPEPLEEKTKAPPKRNHTCFALLTLVCGQTGNALHFERRIELDYRPYENESLRIDGQLHKLEDIVQNADNGRLELLLVRQQVESGTQTGAQLTDLGWVQLKDPGVRG